MIASLMPTLAIKSVIHITTENWVLLNMGVLVGWGFWWTRSSAAMKVFFDRRYEWERQKQQHPERDLAWFFREFEKYERVNHRLVFLLPFIHIGLFIIALGMVLQLEGR